MTDAATAKRALRGQLLARRRELSARDLAESAGALRDVLNEQAELTSAGMVAAYVSVGGEPGSGPLLEELEEHGVQTLLPIQLPDDDLDWARYTGPLGLAPANRGVMEPQARRLGVDAVRRATVVLVPALAVDRRGYRLGRGGGSYDRVLARLIGTEALTVALLHDGELLDLPVPRESHDLPVHAVATPSGLIRLR